MIALVMVGLGAVLAASEVAFTVIEWVGVAYLAWLGIRFWRSDELPLAAGGDTSPASWVRLALQEFWVCMTNPKAVLLFTAFLPPFVDPSGPWASQFLTLGIASSRSKRSRPAATRLPAAAPGARSRPARCEARESGRGRDDAGGGRLARDRAAQRLTLTPAPSPSLRGGR